MTRGPQIWGLAAIGAHQLSRFALGVQ
eukprot:COSAG01_NODE_59550_length_299_cov_2.785000_2_plen_26_part_01